MERLPRLGNTMLSLMAGSLMVEFVGFGFNPTGFALTLPLLTAALPPSVREPSKCCFHLYTSLLLLPSVLQPSCLYAWASTILHLTFPRSVDCVCVCTVCFPSTPTKPNIQNPASERLLTSTILSFACLGTYSSSSESKSKSPVVP